METITPNAPRLVSHPVLLQRWSYISFLHWRCSAGSIQAMLPRGLRADTFDGSAWVGITPFRVERLRVPGLPPLPWISFFPETNMRTYVVGPDGSRGIWFFTLEASRLAAVAGARLAYGLPYRWASMSVDAAGDEWIYRSSRGPALTHIRVHPGDPCSGELELFLTARFRLFTERAGRLFRADVEHEPWPLRGAQAPRCEQTLTEELGLGRIPGEPLVHYSRGVDTRISSLAPL